jgi:demethoxyubiquinone hydroxylase (CLK1/Coq7/Cat5 family)
MQLLMLIHVRHQAPLYKALSNVIMAGCRASIWIAERF